MIDVLPKQLIINGKLYSHSQFQQMATNFSAVDNPVLQQLWQFMAQWVDNNSLISLKTSGSTGTPKSIVVEKSKMLASAAITINYFGLKPGMKVLLCLSPEFIAGKMMIVRAMLGGLDLVTTDLSANPLRNLTQTVDFAAMVPMQCAKAFEDTPDKFALIKTLIVGGSGIGEWLSDQFLKIETAVFQTYGMTETLSHIAVRRVNGPKASKSYFLLTGVKIDLDERSCLLIDAPHISTETIVTNDVAVIHDDGTFNIEGRADDIVISAGNKLNPAQIEAKIEGILKKPCTLVAVPSKSAGTQLVLVLTERLSTSQIFQIWKKLEDGLPAAEIPRQLLILNSLPMLPGGKTDRLRLIQMAGESFY